MAGDRERAFGLASTDVGLELRPKNIGAPVKRVEDPRLLTGQGAFTADRIVPGALQVAFRRSDHAHARISGINTAPATDMPDREPPGPISSMSRSSKGAGCCHDGKTDLWCHI